MRVRSRLAAATVALLATAGCGGGSSPTQPSSTSSTTTTTTTTTTTGTGGTGSSTTNQAPTARFTFTPASPQVSQAVAFDATTSSDPDAGDTLTYSWAFGDGGTATGATTSHTYTSAGSFTATVTVSDGKGGTHSASHAVAVAQGTTTTTVTVAYVQDIRPIFAADCNRCHSGSRPDAGLDLSTYAGTMRVVTKGNANSTLIRFTQSGAAMYQYFSGDRASKANLIRTWIVSNNAAETR